MSLCDGMIICYDIKHSNLTIDIMITSHHKMCKGNIYMNKNPDSKMKWSDIVKGLAILLIIIGNSPGISAYLRAVIFSFHLPMFMIMNGYLIKDYDPKKNIIRSFKSLILPYIAICVAQAFVSMLTAPDLTQAGNTFFQSLNDMVVGMSITSSLFPGYGSVGPVWIITCLFLAENIYVLLMYFIKGFPVLLKDILILAVSVCGYILSTYVGFLPWNLDVALYSVLFIAAGDLFKSIRFFENKDLFKLLVPVIIWVNIFLYQGVFIDLAARQYPYVYSGAAAAIAGSVVVMQGCLFLHGQSKTLSRVLMWYGKHFILILGLHNLELRLIPWEKLGGSLSGLSLIFGSFPGQLILRLLLITVCAYILSKIHENAKKGGFSDKSKGESKNDSNIGLKSEYKNVSNIEFTSDIKATQKKKRLDWPDVAKGICILAVIAGHMGIPFVNQLVFLWHLPVFFLIAGLFLKIVPDKTALKNKVRRLLFPYYISCIAICIIAGLRALVSGMSLSEAVLPWIKASLYAAGDSWAEPFPIKGIGAIWFLWALFIAIMITNHFAERKAGPVIILIIAILGWASFTYTGIWLPLSIQAGMLCSLYLLIGYQAAKHAFTLDSLHPLILIGAGIIAAIGIQHFKGFWLVHNYMGNGWFDFAFSLCASLMIMVLSSYISKNYPLIKKILIFYGINSLIILCLHIIELDVAPIKNIVYSAIEHAHISISEVIMMTLVYIAKIIYVTVGVLIINKLMTIWKVSKAAL